MYEEKPEITEAVDTVYALTIALKRGEMLTHSAVREVLGIVPHEGPWDHIIRKVGRRLQKERGIAFWPNIRDGCKLCTVAEQLTLPIERAKRGLRQVRKGRKSVEALPDTSLSIQQRRAKAFLAERARETERAMRRDMKAQRQQIKPTQTLPRRVASPSPLSAGKGVAR